MKMERLSQLKVASKDIVTSTIRCKTFLNRIWDGIKRHNFSRTQKKGSNYEDKQFHLHWQVITKHDVNGSTEIQIKNGLLSEM